MYWWSSTISLVLSGYFLASLLELLRSRRGGAVAVERSLLIHMHLPNKISREFPHILRVISLSNAPAQLDEPIVRSFGR